MMSSLILIFKNKKLVFVYNPCVCACNTNLTKKEVQVNFYQKLKIKEFCIKNNIEYSF